MSFKGLFVVGIVALFVVAPSIAMKSSDTVLSLFVRHTRKESKSFDKKVTYTISPGTEKYVARLADGREVYVFFNKDMAHGHFQLACMVRKGCGEDMTCDGLGLIDVSHVLQEWKHSFENDEGAQEHLVFSARLNKDE